MLSRRELITAGVAGGLHPTLAASSDAAALGPAAGQQSDRELQQLSRSIDKLAADLQESLTSNSLSHGFVAKLREFMQVFFRSNGKFPDFIDIGVAVFYDVYDWHVKNRQQLTITRGTDGRYWMQFMFTNFFSLGPPRGDQDLLHARLLQGRSLAHHRSGAAPRAGALPAREGRR